MLSPAVGQSPQKHAFLGHKKGVSPRKFKLKIWIFICLRENINFKSEFPVENVNVSGDWEHGLWQAMWFRVGL